MRSRQHRLFGLSLNLSTMRLTGRRIACVRRYLENSTPEPSGSHGCDGMDAMAGMPTGRLLISPRAHASMDAANAIWAAIGYLGKNRVDRKQLTDGSAEATAVVDVNISGSVRVGSERKRSIKESFSGTLHIGADQPSSKSSGVDQSHLIALLLSTHPDAEKALATIEAYFVKNGDLKPIAKAKIETVDQLLKRLRQSVPTTKAGALTYRTTPTGK